MNNFVRDFLWAETVIAALIAIRYGYVAATDSEGPRKGRARLTASLAFSSSFMLSALFVLVFKWTRPLFEFEGTVESVHVRDSDNRHYSADLRIITTSGGEISVHTSDSSPLFRAGEHLRGRYRGDTTELVKAYFYASDGSQEGVFNGFSTIRLYIGLLVGLFAVWASFRKYRRDPHGRESR